ncbi:MAG: HPP family protein [Betaproteobacteria bacterium]|nr:HPP family protein [Betaproteobacteria bacterium]
MQAAEVEATPRRLRMMGEVLALVYVAAIATLAGITGVSTILFPELGALAHDVFTRPHGVWARSPLWLATTPAAAALAGILIARHMSFGLVSVFLSVGSSVALIQALQSPIAPAISAGLLPLVLGVTSWSYPPSILLGTAALALLGTMRTALFPPAAPQSSPNDRDNADDAVEATASGLAWMPHFFAFVLAVAALALRTGWHLLLFPPLIVMGYEMFAHPTICPWAGRPWALLLACTACAAFAVAFINLLGMGPLAAVCSLGAGVLVLSVLDLHVPPALAVGLLPFIISHPNWKLPLAVAAGILLLTRAFALWQWLDVMKERAQRT